MKALLCRSLGRQPSPGLSSPSECPASAPPAPRLGHRSRLCPATPLVSPLLAAAGSSAPSHFLRETEPSTPSLSAKRLPLWCQEGLARRASASWMEGGSAPPGQQHLHGHRVSWTEPESRGSLASVVNHLPTSLCFPKPKRGCFTGAAGVDTCPEGTKSPPRSPSANPPAGAGRPEHCPLCTLFFLKWALTPGLLRHRAAHPALLLLRQGLAEASHLCCSCLSLELLDRCLLEAVGRLAQSLARRQQCEQDRGSFLAPACSLSGSDHGQVQKVFTEG